MIADNMDNTVPMKILLLQIALRPFRPLRQAQGPQEPQESRFLLSIPARHL